MNCRIAYSGIVIASAALAFQAFAVPALKEREQAVAIRKATHDILGAWYTVSVADGNTNTGEDRGDIITYEGNRFSQKRNGQVYQSGTFEIVDATSNPKQIDFHVTEGAQKGRHFRAIFTQNGDSLIGCCDHGENDRPTEFSGQAGYYRVGKRVKD